SSVVASWDSSAHEHCALNKTTPSGDLVYILVKVQLKLSHPAEMLLTLRKRLCLQMTKIPSFPVAWFRRFMNNGQNITGTGIFYDLVAHVPKSSLDPEARETLALMAARSQDSSEHNGGASAGVNNSIVGESYIEKYTRGISEVESILALDRLRQEVAIRELLGASVKRSMKKTTSLPIAEALRNPTLCLMPRSESTVTNLTSPSSLILPSKKSLTSLKEENHQEHQNAIDPQEPKTSSLASSGYGSQHFLAKNRDSDDSVLRASEISPKNLHSASFPSSAATEPPKKQIDGSHNPFERPKIRCLACEFGLKFDYKNTRLLSQFLSSFSGRLFDKHITGLCERKQLELRQAVETARRAGLAPILTKNLKFLRDPKICDPMNPVKPNPF
uniref:Kinesin-like domain-containing protein n=1 Tax=Romanomermis culicivorax TaxID=13658 RepID=A0A915IN91_ROMCU